jgi:hypothetical protein
LTEVLLRIHLLPVLNVIVLLARLREVIPLSVVTAIHFDKRSSFHLYKFLGWSDLRYLKSFESN